MKKYRSLLSLLLAFVMVLTAVPMEAKAETGTAAGKSYDVIYETNPLYPHLEAEEAEIKKLKKKPATGQNTIADTGEEIPTLEGEDALAEFLSNQYAYRKSEIPFYFITDEDCEVKMTDDENTSHPLEEITFCRKIFRLGMRNSLLSDRGDYQKYSWASYGVLEEVNRKTKLEDGRYRYKYTYSVRYYTTLSEEQQVTTEVNRLIQEWNLQEMSVYEKVKTVYDYLVETVVYDSAHLEENEKYPYMYTAYGALIDKTCVCQGYAMAFYRLLREAGVMVRMIGGYSNDVGHAWNIVRVNGMWYEADSTWDSTGYHRAVQNEEAYEYKYFLKNETEFSTNHSRDPEYLEDSFLDQYPVSEEDDYSEDLPMTLPLNEGEFSLSKTKYEYDGTDHYPEVNGPVYLYEDIDYTYTYEETKNAGTGIVEITGIGEFSGTFQKTFTITPLELKGVSAKDFSGYCDGKAHSITVSVPDNTCKVTYSQSENGTYSTKKPSYKDPGTYTVYYKVSNGNYETDGSGKVEIKLKTPSVSASNVSSGVKVKWKEITGADGYRVYRKPSSGGSWTRVAEIKKGSTVSWTNRADAESNAVKSGSTYRYTVRACYGNILSSYDKEGAKIKYLAQPSVTVKNASTGVKISWKKISGASEYRVYCRTSANDDWKRIKTITDGSTVSYAYKNADVNGKKYYFTVRARSGDYLSSYASKTFYHLSRPSISSLSNTASKKITVKWAKNSKVTGYQIEYALDSKFENEERVTISGADTVAKSIKNLTKGKTYYVRLRGYKEVSGTSYYSAWSSAKTVKITR